MNLPKFEKILSGRKSFNLEGELVVNLKAGYRGIRHVRFIPFDRVLVDYSTGKLCYSFLLYGEEVASVVAWCERLEFFRDEVMYFAHVFTIQAPSSLIKATRD